MNETELESLVIRLVGDADEYLKMLDEARDAIAATAKEVETMAAAIEGAGSEMLHGAASQASAAADEISDAGEAISDTSSIAESTSDVMSTLGESLNNVGTVVSGVKDAFGDFQDTLEEVAAAYIAFRIELAVLNAYAEAELANIRLGAAIKSHSGDVQSVTEDYRRFAAEMQRTTATAMTTTTVMLQQAESLELTGAVAKRAVRNAIALAAAKGGEANSYIRATAALEKGHVIARLIDPALLKVEDGSKRVAAAQTKLAKDFEVATASMSSTRKQSQQLSNAVSDLAEDLGGVLAPGFSVVTGSLTGIITWFRELNPVIKTVTLASASLAVGLFGLVAVFTPLRMAVIYLIDSYKSLKKWLAAVAAEMQTFGGKMAILKFALLAVGAVAVTAGIALASYLLDALLKTKEFNVELERSKRLLDELIKARGKQAEAAVEKIQKTTDIAGSRAGKSAAEKELERQQNELERLSESLVKARAEVDKEDVSWRPLSGRGTYQGLREAKDKLDVLSSTYAHQQGVVKGLQDQIKNLKGPDKEVIKGFRDLTDAIGLTVPPFNLFAAAANVVKGIQKQAAEEDKKAAAEKAKLTEDIKELTTALEDELDMYEASSDKLAIHKLMQRGATEEQLAAAREALALKGIMKDQADEFDRVNQTIEELMTPLQKYEDRVAELQDLLGAGLPQETFEEGMRKAQEELEETGKKAKKAKEEIQKFDTALIGSAEAAQRITAFEDMIKGFGKDGAELTKQITPAIQAARQEMAGAFPQGLVALGATPEEVAAMFPKRGGGALAQPGGGLAGVPDIRQIGEMLAAIEPIEAIQQPDWLMVQEQLKQLGADKDVINAAVADMTMGMARDPNRVAEDVRLARDAKRIEAALNEETARQAALPMRQETKDEIMAGKPEEGTVLAKLQEIVNLLAEQNKKPTLEVEAADVAG